MGQFTLTAFPQGRLHPITQKRYLKKKKATVVQLLVLFRAEALCQRPDICFWQHGDVDTLREPNTLND